MENLPYQLTGGNRRMSGMRLNRICGGKLMTRLVQGDVGSGKTIGIPCDDHDSRKRLSERHHIPHKCSPDSIMKL